MVLEDNLRCPSGVSYMLENRELLKRTFPEVLGKTRVKSISDYPNKLLQMLQHITDRPNPTVCVLTPGIYNSAYFEHCFLSKCMGCELAKGQDLFVYNKKVYLKTTQGPKQIHIIYRRIDDEFIDRMSGGISIMGKTTLPCQVEKINDFTFKIILVQGLNRQIRRMCYQLHYEVLELIRIRIGNVTLGDLRPNEYRMLDRSYEL